MVLDIEIRGVEEFRLQEIHNQYTNGDKIFTLATRVPVVKYQMRKLVQETHLNEDGLVYVYFDGSIMGYVKPEWTEWQDVPIEVKK